MTKPKPKPKPISESISEESLGGNGEQVAKLQSPNVNLKNKKGKQKEKTQLMGQKSSSSSKKRMSKATNQIQSSSLLSTTHSSSMDAKIISHNTNNSSRISTSGKRGRKTQSELVSISTPKYTTSHENDACSSSKSKFPLPTPSKNQVKHPEITSIPTSISLPPQQNIPIQRPLQPNKNKRSVSIPLTIPSNPEKPVHPRSNSTPNPSPSVPQSLIPISPKLCKRFYEALVLLTVFGSNRGERVLEEEFQADDYVDEVSSSNEIEVEIRGEQNITPIIEDDEMNKINRIKLRRSFTRHLAYLCDYDKGGDSTTAIALQQLGTGEIVYHVAWNKCSNSQKDVGFLSKVLGLLGGIMMDAGEEKDKIEEEIFMLSVKHAAKRIAYYSGDLGRHINFVINEWKVELGVEIKDSLPQLHTWLCKFLTLAKNLPPLCRFCYETITSSEFGKLHHLIQSNHIFASRFTSIRHNIGRLNHTLKAVKVLLSARSHLPSLFIKPHISPIASPPRHPPPLLERNPELSAIVGRMMSDASHIEFYRHTLEQMDHKYQLSQNLHDHCQDPNWKPKVHAELLLLEHFYTGNLDFVDADRYIACSKPACYCCYHYIKAHPGNFVVPGSHHNNYLKWRAPDVKMGDERGERIRMEILIGMSKVFREDVLQQILEKREPRRRKPDSATEISSVRLGVDGFKKSILEDFSLVENDVRREGIGLEADHGSLAGDYDSEEMESEEKEIYKKQDRNEVNNDDTSQSIESTGGGEHDIDVFDSGNSSEDDEGGVFL